MARNHPLIHKTYFTLSSWKKQKLWRFLFTSPFSPLNETRNWWLRSRVTQYAADLMHANDLKQLRIDSFCFWWRSWYRSLTQNRVRNYIVNNRLKFQMQSETCFDLRTISRIYFIALISIQCFVLIVRCNKKPLDQSFCRLLVHAVKSSRWLTISGFI